MGPVPTASDARTSTVTWVPPTGTGASAIQADVPAHMTGILRGGYAATMQHIRSGLVAASFMTGLVLATGLVAAAPAVAAPAKRPARFVATGIYADYLDARFAANNADADMAAEEFLRSRRVLVRKMGAYGLPDCLRITIAEEPALRACVEALGDFVKQAATQ